MFDATWQFGQFFLPAPVALGVVAVIGYFVGRWRREYPQQVDAQMRRELKRAQVVVRELENVSRLSHHGLAELENHIGRFKIRLQKLSSANPGEAMWQELCGEAEVLLRPTLRMASQLAAAYDELRQQCAQLMSFTEVRTDPLTGVSNRRALDEALAGLISLLNRYESGFAIVILDIDHFKKLNDEQGHLYGDEILTGVARLMDENVRDTDQVARYGGEEFVILMPYTNLAGAAQFANRLRERLAAALPVTISAGVAVAASGDTPQTLVARADAALYLAKQQGRNRSCVHDGQRIASFAEFAHFAINLPEHQPIRPAPRGTEKVAVQDHPAAMLEQREAKTPEAPRHSEMPVSQHSPGRDLRPTAETQREQSTERSPAEINLLELGGKPTPPPETPILESETRS